MESSPFDNSVVIGQFHVSNDASSKTAAQSNEPSKKMEMQVNQEKRAWLIVVGCFILYFNMLGAIYSFGKYDPFQNVILRPDVILYSLFLGIYEAHYALHEFPGQSAKVCVLNYNSRFAILIRNEIKIALIGSACSGTSLAVCLLAGRWVELYGVRVVIISGSVIFSGSLAAAGFCKSVTTLILTQGVLTGIGVGILNIPGTTGISVSVNNHNLSSDSSFFFHLPQL